MHVGSETWDVICRRGEGWDEGGGGNWGERMVKAQGADCSQPSSSFLLFLIPPAALVTSIYRYV